MNTPTPFSGKKPAMNTPGETPAFALWFTGLSGSGKTTLGQMLMPRLKVINPLVKLLDGDVLRNGLNNNLGFSLADRRENLRRAAEVSKLFVDSGFITVNCFITPTHDVQQMVQQIVGAGRLVTVYLDTPVEVCEQRDVKGLYQKARQGLIADFTGISSPFEAPENPTITLSTHLMNSEQAVEKIMEVLGMDW